MCAYCCFNCLSQQIFGPCMIISTTDECFVLFWWVGYPPLAYQFLKLVQKDLLTRRKESKIKMKTSCTASLLSSVELSPLFHINWYRWSCIIPGHTGAGEVCSIWSEPRTSTSRLWFHFSYAWLNTTKKWSNVHSMYSRFHVCSYSNLPTSGEAARCSAACIYSRLPERSSLQDFMLWKGLEDHDGFRCQCKVTATDLNFSLHNPI